MSGPKIGSIQGDEYTEASSATNTHTLNSINRPEDLVARREPPVAFINRDRTHSDSDGNVHGRGYNDKFKLANLDDRETPRKMVILLGAISPCALEGDGVVWSGKEK